MNTPVQKKSEKNTQHELKALLKPGKHFNMTKEMKRLLGGTTGIKRFMIDAQLQSMIKPVREKKEDKK